MIYSLEGIISQKKDNFIVLEVRGVGYRIFTPRSVLEKLPEEGKTARLFCYMNIREDAMELYGFLHEKEREAFEMLTSVSGIGPKIAARVLDVASIEQIAAAIHEGKPELLTKASGVGRKTAERVVIELRGKMAGWSDGALAKTMESDRDIIEALANLGYVKGDIRDALKKINPEAEKLEDRLRAALKILKK